MGDQIPYDPEKLIEITPGIFKRWADLTPEETRQSLALVQRWIQLERRENALLERVLIEGLERMYREAGAPPLPFPIEIVGRRDRSRSLPQLQHDFDALKAFAQGIGIEEADLDAS